MELDRGPEGQEQHREAHLLDAIGDRWISGPKACRSKPAIAETRLIGL